MGKTITEKILARASRRDRVNPGETIEAKIGLLMMHDITSSDAIKLLRQEFGNRIAPGLEVVVTPDHYVPGKDIASAILYQELRGFVDEQQALGANVVGYMIEGGDYGVCHVMLPEKGHVFPGEVIVGGDSHTCTYGALGCYATGVGSTDLARAFIDGKCWFKVPRVIKFIYQGKFKKWVGGKDLILYTIGNIGVDGALDKVMEFSGPVIRTLSMDDRFAMSNMAIEAGGVTGVIEPDEITLDYIKEVHSQQSIVHRQKKEPWTVDRGPWTKLTSDKNAQYEKTYEWDISDLEPQVASPHLPSNVKPVSKLKEIKIDQVVIGSCTNGRISDLKMAAKILKGKKIKSGLRLIVIPATQKIYLEAVKDGLAEIFVQAGGVFSTPTCGPCLGGHMGVLAEGEVCLATTNRNFIGRMGNPKSFVYLSNPAVAAASAITGRITHPQEIIEKG